MPYQFITTRPCLSPTFNQSNSTASNLAPVSLFDIVYGMYLFTILDPEKKKKSSECTYIENSLSWAIGMDSFEWRRFKDLILSSYSVLPVNLNPGAKGNAFYSKAQCLQFAAFHFHDTFTLPITVLIFTMHLRDKRGTLQGIQRRKVHYDRREHIGHIGMKCVYPTV